MCNLYTINFTHFKDTFPFLINLELWNHHYNTSLEHFRHLKNIPHDHLQSLPHSYPQLPQILFKKQLYWDLTHVIQFIHLKGTIQWL